MIAFDAGRLAETLDPLLRNLPLGTDQLEELANVLAEAAVAELNEQRRLFIAQQIDPSAWDFKAVYSTESRNAARHRALSAADNVLAVVLS